jgi:hypothetical protein
LIVFGSRVSHYAETWQFIHTNFCKNNQLRTVSYQSNTLFLWSVWFETEGIEWYYFNDCLNIFILIINFLCMNIIYWNSSLPWSFKIRFDKYKQNRQKSFSIFLPLSSFSSLSICIFLFYSLSLLLRQTLFVFLIPLCFLFSSDCHFVYSVVVPISHPNLFDSVISHLLAQLVG